MGLERIKVIAFDADDTLWVNEPLFRNAEDRFCELMKNYIAKDECNRMLYKFEMKNLPMYGYGIKPFILSLIEAGMAITKNNLPSKTVLALIDIGKEMLDAPVELLDGIEYTLAGLAGQFKLVMATKGDLLDQQRKLIKSGLEQYFHHIEIVSDKTQKEYQKLIHHLDIKNHEFLMVGNSLKSDVIPVLEINAHAVHIPFHTTWEHEMVHDEVEHPNFIQLETPKALLELLRNA